MNEMEIIKKFKKDLKKLGYDLIETEVPVRMGTRRGIADIVVYQREGNKRVPFIVVEIKSGKSDMEGGWLQAAGYASALRAPFALVTNGVNIESYDVTGGINNIKEIDGIPVPRSERSSEQVYWIVMDRLRGAYTSFDNRLDVFLELYIVSKWIKKLHPDKANYSYLSNMPVSEYIEGRKNALEYFSLDDLIEVYQGEHWRIWAECLGEILESNIKINDILDILVESRHRYGTEFTTPKELVHFVADLSSIKKASNIADICCGTGYLLITCSKVMGGKVDVTGIEINRRIALIAKILVLEENIKGNIIVGNSLYCKEIAKMENKYDLVVCHPPFGGMFKKIEKEDIFNKDLIKKAGAKKYEDIFLLMNIFVTKPNGIVSIIIPDSFLFSFSSSSVREYIQKNCRILTVISFPHGMLKNTKIKTSLLMLQKKKIDEKIGSYEIFMGAIPKKSKDLKKDLNEMAERFKKWWEDNE